MRTIGHIARPLWANYAYRAPTVVAKALGMICCICAKSAMLTGLPVHATLAHVWRLKFLCVVFGIACDGAAWYHNLTQSPNESATSLDLCMGFRRSHFRCVCLWHVRRCSMLLGVGQSARSYIDFAC